MKINLLSPCWR